MKHLQIYHAIQAISDQGSFRKASESLLISASALNRQIKALEEELGAELFERHATGVSLSPAGEIYHRLFFEHIAQMDRAKSTVAEMRDGQRGEIRLVASPDISAGFLPRLVRQFRVDHPRVALQVAQASRTSYAAELSDHRADLALVVQPEIVDGIETLAAASCQLVVVGPEEEPVDLSQINSAPLALPDPDMGIRGPLDHFLKSRRLAAQPSIVSPNLMPTLAGDPLIQFWLGCDLPDPAIGRPLPAPKPPRATVVLLQRSGNPQSAAAQRFSRQAAAAIEALEL